LLKKVAGILAAGSRAMRRQNFARSGNFFLLVLFKPGWPPCAGLATLRRACMTLLPIVARELRVISRRAATYWTRFTCGVLAIVVGGIAFAALYQKSSRDTGFGIFVCLSVIAFIYSLIAGALSTADCVSEEKREGTLGLLFLTDLKSYDIVLGKMAASSLTGVYGLLAIFPVLGVPLLLGGVAPSEFWRVILVCVNNLFLSLTLGMLCSAICKDERKSIALTLLIIGLLTGGLPGLVAGIANEISRGNPLYPLFNEHAYVLLAPSPGFTCFTAFDATFKNVLGTGNGHWFYISLGVMHAMGWGALLLTMAILPRVWQDKAATAQTLRRREQWRTLTGGPAEARDAFRRRLLEINPFYWLASRDHFKVALVWLWIGAGALIWMFGLVKARHDWLEPTTYVVTVLLAHSLFKCWLPIEAARRFGADRRSGALELLLSTPLSVNEILRGQGLALLRQFGPAAALICAVDFLFLGLGLRNMGSERGEWTRYGLAAIVIFVFDLITLALVAMWGSLRSRKTSTAGLSAIVRVCIVPWFLMGLFIGAAAILEEVFQFNSFGSISDQVFLAAWFFISVLIDLLLSLSALRNLRTQFRLVVTQRLESRAGFWERWHRRKPVEVKQ
jgi:ABC-type transport system involved in cytochrome c biogenesis permease component